MKRLFLLMVLFVIILTRMAFSQQTSVFNDPKKEWFKEAKFGMFIHWGVYSKLAGTWQGSRNAPSIWGYDAWIQLFANISAKDYLGVANTFNPVKFNAKEIVALAKSTGMKYLVITTKHHDGFCMFDSKYTKFDIADATPFKRDPLKELSDECKKQGIVFCIYYSIPDWNHPELPAQLNTYRWSSNAQPGANPSRYIDYMCDQLKELLTKYDAKMVWFDRGDNTTFNIDGVSYPTAVNAKKIIETIHSVDPSILINNRLDTAADFITPEQVIPQDKELRYFESCMTMGKAWGFTTYDTVKPAVTIIEMLCDVVHKGGNFLLNIGPKGDGSLQQNQVDTLKKVGRWMQANSEAIYKTEKSPWEQIPDWGRISRKDNTLYVMIFKQPQIGFGILQGIKEMPLRIRQLDQSKPTFDLRPRLLNGGLWFLVQQHFVQKEPLVYAFDFAAGVLDDIAE